MSSQQRVRDPVHGLIVFRADSEIDQAAWRLINTREFQRMRRIKQLGFSDLVYPGAAHSRLAHSIGVYHTARRLVGIVADRLPPERRNSDRERTVLLAALLHDVGHGPFSHAFEHALPGRSHVDWGAEIILGDTEINAVLREIDGKLPTEIASLLKEEQPKDIYAAVVSSQFDADRLDYLRRDRLMTGVAFGSLDIDWIFDCLDVGSVTLGAPEDPVQEPCLFLNPKGVQVAEEYLEARFRLYMLVYMHKTTRAAEVMFQRLLERLREGADDRELGQLRLYRFLKSEPASLGQYLELDDAVVWAELGEMSRLSNPVIRDLAGRLVERRLYKCFDLGAAVGERDEGNRRHRFMRRLRGHEMPAGSPTFLWTTPRSPATSGTISRALRRSRRFW